MNDALSAGRAQSADRLSIVLAADLLAAGDGECGDRILYLGDRFTTLLDLRARFGERVINVGDALAEELSALSDQLAQLDDLLPRGADPLAWICSDLAERSPYSTSLIRNAGRLRVLERELDGGGALVVATDDAAAARLVWDEARRLGVQADASRSLQRAWRLTGVRRLVRAVRECLAGGRRALARISHLARIRRIRPLPLDRIRAADVLVVVWGRADTFPADAPLEDVPWLGQLSPILQRAGLKLAYLVNPVHWVDDFAAIAANATASPDPVLMMEDCLTIMDVARVCLHGGIQGGTSVSAELATVTSHLLGEDWTHWRPRQARLAAAIGPWLARHEIRPRAVVMLYENHNWEKALRYGIHQALPATRIIGVQQSPFAPLYLNLLPSRRELADGLAPDRLVVMGSRFRDLFLAAGMPEGRVVLGGAPRYASFLANLPPYGARGNANLVLVCCGPDLDENRELVLKAALATSRHPGLRAVVNFHPLTTSDERALVRAFVAGQGVDAAVEWSDLSVRSLLGLSPAAVLYCDTNAAFEALAVGATPIHVGRDCGIDLDKLPDGASIRARSVDAIALAIGESLRTRPPAAAARAFIDQSLGAVDEQAIIAAVIGD